VGCHRKVAFEKLDPNPTLLNEDTIRRVKYFHVDQEVHLNLQELLKSVDGWECEQEVIWKSPTAVTVIGHVDAVYRKDGLVVAVEIKTTHSDKPTSFSYNVRAQPLRLALVVVSASADWRKSKRLQQRRMLLKSD
jgi:hypothetical protein